MILCVTGIQPGDVLVAVTIALTIGGAVVKAGRWVGRIESKIVTVTEMHGARLTMLEAGQSELMKGQNELALQLERRGFPRPSREGTAHS